MTPANDVNLENVVADLLERVERRFYGKYRGVVVDNNDPAVLGRLKVRVPSVLGEKVVSGWATPCVPYGGASDQGLLFVPDVGAGVWVEFEEGDLEFPIWTGTYWSKSAASNEVPSPNGSDGTPTGAPQQPPTRKILKTAKGHTLQFEDADGSESILVYDAVHKNRITLDAAGITITDGKGTTITLGAAGIAIGGQATEKLVKGTSLKAAVNMFLQALNTHVHPHPMGPTLPVAAPFTLDVPLSRHSLE
jgi:uncharacterized protein involved in type VI secretion and phage assembly